MSHPTSFISPSFLFYFTLNILFVVNKWLHYMSLFTGSTKECPIEGCTSSSITPTIIAIKRGMTLQRMKEVILIKLHREAEERVTTIHFCYPTRLDGIAIKMRMMMLRHSLASTNPFNYKPNSKCTSHLRGLHLHQHNVNPHTPLLH